eukprot:83316-Pelagomonas_calceolata.AAC.2
MSSHLLNEWRLARVADSEVLASICSLSHNGSSSNNKGSKCGNTAMHVPEPIPPIALAPSTPYFYLICLLANKLYCSGKHELAGRVLVIPLHSA